MPDIREDSFITGGPAQYIFSEERTPGVFGVALRSLRGLISFIPLTNVYIILSSLAEGPSRYGSRRSLILDAGIRSGRSLGTHGMCQCFCGRFAQFHGCKLAVNGRRNEFCRRALRKRAFEKATRRKYEAAKRNVP
jgi:hypothetical protein